MAAAGVVALLVPFLYKTAILPGILGIIMALITFIPRKRKKLM